MSAGWTDEKHALYIRSMENSFIDQLYNHQHNENQKGGVRKNLKKVDCSSSTRGGGVETSVGDHESGIRTVPGRTPVSHARELGACKGENLHDENTEVSDQNFADTRRKLTQNQPKHARKGH